jgi:alpha/beta superfamily hydrolase
MKPMKLPLIQFVEGPAGLTETAAFLCDLNKPMPSQALLLLHPHPLYGGTMGNKVVATIARVARDGGLAAVAFNFRGAGRSDGKWDHGDGELRDAEAIASLMIAQGVTNLCLAGFSFGGSIAARLIGSLKISHPTCEVIDLLQIAPAVVNFPIEPELLIGVPCKVIFNDDDEVVSPQAIADYADVIGASVVQSESGGHFFHGQLARLKVAVASHYQYRGFV